MDNKKLIFTFIAILLLSKEFECRPNTDHHISKRQSVETVSGQNYRSNGQLISTWDSSKQRLRRSNSKKKSFRKEWQWAHMIPSSMVKPRMDVAPE